MVSVKKRDDFVICTWCRENASFIGLDLLNDYVNVIILHITSQTIWDSAHVPLRHFKEVIEEDLCMIKDWNLISRLPLKGEKKSWKLEWSGIWVIKNGDMKIRM